jgi:hypothetical protein
MTSCGPEIFGSDPVNIKWSVVRGDTSTLRVDFLDNDEITHYNTNAWSYISNAYDPRTDIIDELAVIEGSGYVEISVPSDISTNWGTVFSGTVAELNFDLRVTLSDNTVWTPVVGTISVIGNVSNGL